MLWPEDVVFRLNVALATERLLVVAGPGGSGRDSLAHSVARTLGWAAYHFECSAATTPKDLLYSPGEGRVIRGRADGEGSGVGGIGYRFSPSSNVT